VVDAQGKIEVRDLVTDRAIGSDWLVTRGLKAGDKVVVEGLQAIHPGMEVAVKEADIQPVASTAAPAAPAQ
jgi:membrane fusion protein (multidrug efflux system)